MEKKYNRQFKDIYDALQLLMEEKQNKDDWETEKELDLKNKHNLNLKTRNTRYVSLN